jgi:hypothetical protein
MPPAERQRESLTGRIGPAGPRRKAADGDPVSHPKDEVQVTQYGTSWMQPPRLANGPARQTDWHASNWRQAYRIVRNLRYRIFRATRANHWRRVRSLQKLLRRCHSNRLLSVRRVTQENAGKNTPGVDQVVVKTPEARGQLVDQLASPPPASAQPVRRGYIPKANGKQRPLAHISQMTLGFRHEICAETLEIPAFPTISCPFDRGPQGVTDSMTPCA